MSEEVKNKRKELQQGLAVLENSPLRIVQNSLDDLPEDEKQIVRQMEEEFSFRILVEAEAFYQLDAYRMTIKLLEAYTKIYFNNPTAWNRLGTAYSATDNTTKAIGCFQKAYELEPKDRDFSLNYASTLVEIGEHNLAIDILCKHFQKFPENRLYMYFNWYQSECPMTIIKSAWRIKNTKRIKVVNGIPIVNALPIDGGQYKK